MKKRVVLTIIAVFILVIISLFAALKNSFQNAEINPGIRNETVLNYTEVLLSKKEQGDICAESCSGDKAGIFEYYGSENEGLLYCDCRGSVAFPIKVHNLTTGEFIRYAESYTFTPD